MTAKILRKLKLGKLLIKPLSKLLPKSGLKMSYNEAYAYLSSLCPNNNNSCVSRKPTGIGAESTAAGLDIIIPAYNAAQYIRACLDSVRAQESRFSFRVIAIDDGSTDETAEILDEYGREDSRFLIRHQENRGFSGARNAALDISTAEYILFLDSDDALPPDSLERLMSCAAENAADIVEGSFENIDLSGKMLRRHEHKRGVLEPLRDCSGYVWGKVFKRDIFSDLRFPLDYWYEDSIMMHIIYPRLLSRKSVFGISDVCYRYRVNPHGISRTAAKRIKCIDALWVHLQLYKDRESLKIEKTQEYYDYLLSMAVLTYRRTSLQGERVKQAVFTVFSEFIRTEFEAYTSARDSYRMLEDAIRGNNYRLYSLFCSLI